MSSIAIFWSAAAVVINRFNLNRTHSCDGVIVRLSDRCRMIFAQENRVALFVN
jgi:hypothetical protein